MYALSSSASFFFSPSISGAQKRRVQALIDVGEGHRGILQETCLKATGPHSLYSYSPPGKCVTYFEAHELRLHFWTLLYLLRTQVKKDMACIHGNNIKHLVLFPIPGNRESLGHARPGPTYHRTQGFLSNSVRCFVVLCHHISLLILTSKKMTE
jgi:hypothetical protein